MRFIVNKGAIGELFFSVPTSEELKKAEDQI